MSIDVATVEAVTLDFYNTLVYHRQGSGRGPMLMEYLSSQGLESDPWEHQVLYDLFEGHATDYSPEFDAGEKRTYLLRLTARLFERLNVRAPEGTAAEHVDAVWRVLGPNSLGVYPDVPRVLETLRRAGYPLSIISNWQCGLAHFCHEVGIAGYVDHIISSAEVGAAKPDPEIFRESCNRMSVSCDRVLHVGDSTIDDVEGGRNVGMQVILIQRENTSLAPGTPIIQSLDELIDLLRMAGASRLAGAE